MSVFKSALMACVMATTKVALALLVSMSGASAQSPSFPSCVNDYRAEIASGQRSPHYPRCLDAHSPRGPSLQGEPQIENQAFNCPSGQVFSGGSCITIQNQGAASGSTCGLGTAEYRERRNTWSWSSASFNCNGSAVSYSPSSQKWTSACPSGYTGRVVYLSPNGGISDSLIAYCEKI